MPEHVPGSPHADPEGLRRHSARLLAFLAALLGALLLSGFLLFAWTLFERSLASRSATARQHLEGVLARRALVEQFARAAPNAVGVGEASPLLAKEPWMRMPAAPGRSAVALRASEAGEPTALPGMDQALRLGVLHAIFWPEETRVQAILVSASGVPIALAPADDEPAPVSVPPVRAVAGDHPCAWRSEDGALWCLGSGLVADGATSGATVAIRVAASWLLGPVTPGRLALRDGAGPLIGRSPPEGRVSWAPSGWRFADGMLWWTPDASSEGWQAQYGFSWQAVRDENLRTLGLAVAVMLALFMAGAWCALRLRRQMLPLRLGEARDQTPPGLEDEGEHSAAMENVIGRDAELPIEPEPAIAAERAMRSALFAGVSEQIRGPLQGVLNALVPLQDSPLDARQRGLLASALYSGRELEHQLDDLRDLAGIEVGRLALAEDRFDPLLLIERAVRDAARLAKAKGLGLICCLPPNLPFLRGDAARLRRMLELMLANAIGFTAQGHVRVRALARMEGEDCVLGLAVLGAGPALPPDWQRALFESFEPGGRSGGGVRSLSTASRIASLMGGSLELENRPDAGNAFTLVLRLPRERVRKRQPLPPLPPVRIAVSDADFAAHLKVLLRAHEIGIAADEPASSVLLLTDASEPSNSFAGVVQLLVDGPLQPAPAPDASNGWRVSSLAQASILAALVAAGGAAAARNAADSVPVAEGAVVSWVGVGLPSTVRDEVEQISGMLAAGARATALEQLGRLRASLASHGSVRAIAACAALEHALEQRAAPSVVRAAAARLVECVLPASGDSR